MHPRAKATIAAAALIVAALPGANPALAADPVEVSFSATGAEQTWVVPDGVSSIHVVLIGGKGGDAGPGGFGHVATGDLAVTAGSTIFLEVGGNGGDSIGLPGAAGGFNGGAPGGSGTLNAGAGGGGASDLRTVARTAPGTLDSRLIVAAGGGGRGGSLTVGANGGSAGTAGANAPAPHGGGGSGGAPGTASTFGFGGGSNGFTGDGDDGAAGVGGVGGTQPTLPQTNGGGGGGGGYYGGGGGGGGAFADGGGGGGGGSSFTGTATGTSVVVDTSGVPSITITYQVDDTPPDPTPAPDTGVVDADVTVPTSAACVELSTTDISFGTQRFGAVNVQADPSITVTNCSGTDETLFARGTSAAGNGATWTLVDNAGTCGAGTLDPDDFHLKLRRPADEVDPVTQLSSNNKEIAELTGGDQTVVEALIDMPCPGSEGAGQTMGMNIVFVVTELE